MKLYLGSNVWQENLELLEILDKSKHSALRNWITQTFTASFLSLLVEEELLFKCFKRTKKTFLEKRDERVEHQNCSEY